MNCRECIFGLAIWILAGCGVFAQTDGGPRVAHPVRTTWVSQGVGLASLAEPTLVEANPEKYSTIRVRYRVELAAGGAPITVDVIAIPGASLAQIRDNLLASETSSVHHDLLIFEGGKNDALNAPNVAALRTLYRGVIDTVSARADALGVPLFVQEVEPIIPEVLSERGFDGPRYENNILGINAELALIDTSHNIGVILTYDEFKPHFDKNDPLSWCRNPANSGVLDGSHLSQYGTEALGKAWWDGIAATVLASRTRPVRVAVYGDSIAAAEYLPAEQRPAAWLISEAVAAVTGAEEWIAYE